MYLISTDTFKGSIPQKRGGVEYRMDRNKFSQSEFLTIALI